MGPARDLLAVALVAGPASAVGLALVTSGLLSPLAVGGGAVIAVGLALLMLLRGLETLAVGLLVGGVLASSWNAVAVGPLKPGPVLLAVAALLLGVLAIAHRTPVRIPPWIWPLAVAVVLVVLSVLVRPPEPGYLALRFPGSAEIEVPRLGDLVAVSLVEGLQWLVAAVAVPVAVCLALVRRPGLARSLADAWVLGAAVSAAVAIADDTGLTEISAMLLPVVDSGGRQAGLSAQPNHLAVAIAIAAPVLVWRLLAGGRRVRVVGAGVAVVLAGGLWASESRGALVTTVVGVVAMLLVDARGRRRLVPLGAAVLLGGIGAALFLAEEVRGVAAGLRLVDAEASTSGSNELRAHIARQALEDWSYSPVHGIGLMVLNQAHSIVLQLVASGGLVLLGGFALSIGGALVAAWSRRDDDDGLAAALAVAIATWLLVGVVENLLADLFLYVPFALVAGLRARGRGPAPPAPEHPPTREHPRHPQSRPQFVPGGTPS